MIKLRHYKKHMGPPVKPVKVKTSFKLRIYRARVKIEPVTARIRTWMGFLDRAPFSVKFLIFMILVFLFMFGMNKVRFEYWKNTVTKAYPDIVRAVYDDKGNLVQASPLDKILVEFISRSQAYYFLLFGIFISLTLRNIWCFIGTPKHQ